MSPTQSPARVAAAAAIGAVIEWYDFFLYGTASGLVFTKLYFSGLSDTAALLASFGVFAVGFLARPIGGLLFGHFGDRIGRKRMLIWTLVVMGLGTAAIGLLPTYSTLGIWAPVLLVVLRVLQGIGVGGEYGGAVLLAVESAPRGRRGFYGSFAHIGVPGGLALAAGVLSIASLLPDDAFFAWGWRVCFLFSVVLLGVGAWIRRSVLETAAFAELRERREVERFPLGEVARRQPGVLLLGMGTRFIEGVTFNLFSVFYLTYAVTDAGVSRSLSLQAITAGGLVGIVVTVLAGRLSDRVGRRVVFGFGSLLAGLFALPATVLLSSGSTGPVVAAFVGGLGLVYGLIYGPLAAFWSELFETRYRYSALSALYQLSGIVASGLTPLIAAWLVTRGGGSLLWVALYQIAVAAVSLVCVIVLPETRHRDLAEVGRPALAGETAEEESTPIAA